MEYNELWSRLFQEEKKYAKAAEILRALWSISFDENIDAKDAIQQIRNVLEYNVKDPKKKPY